MTTLFVAAPGTVVQIPTMEATPLQIRLEGWQGFEGFGAIITGAQVEQSSRIQLSYSLNDYLYAYVFGENVGTVMLSGIAFASGCGFSGTTGPESILQYYEDNRISKRGTPVVIQVGRSRAGTAQGLLHSVNVGITDPQQHLSQWSLKFHKIPQR